EPAHQLALLVKALAPVAVEAAVRVEVDVAARMDVAQDLLHEGDVRRVGGPDEPARVEAELVPGRAEEPAHAVHERLRRYPRLGRCLCDLVSVLVRARDAERASTALAPE